jgi:hypothetical protein
MSRSINGWSHVAFNQVPHSQNRIHSDEVAQSFGFTGALVPGVTISAYLMHPAVEAWGLDWLNRGAAHVRVQAPLYDEHRFDVETRVRAGGGYDAELRSDGTLCAIANVDLPSECPAVPGYRGDRMLDEQYVAPHATRESMERLMETGCRAKGFRWSAEHEMAAYVREQQSMPALLRTDGAMGSVGHANPAMLLGCANRHFASVARMSPWVHLETRSQNFRCVPLDTRLVSEMTILDLFERKGHEFADCEFRLFRADDQACVFTVWQRAIYRMRGAE